MGRLSTDGSLALAPRKARGAYFTPTEVCDFLAGWAIRSPSDRVLEPSCGDAKFLVAAATRLETLDAQPGLWEAQLVGVDLHAPTVDQARQALARKRPSVELRHGDFFDEPATPDFDVVLGNPPFVRYQAFGGEGREKGLRAALAGGVNLNGLASSWAAFVVHASRFLKDGGRLGFVLPAELLTVNYAAPVRRFLLERFARLRMVVFEELVFPGVLEDTVLLLAEGSGGCDHFEIRQVRAAAALPASLPKRWTQVATDGNNKWSHALVSADAWDAYRHAATGDHFEELSHWGRAYLGAVTGDNDYFALTGEMMQEHGLGPRDVARISPPGSRHLVGLEMSESAWTQLGAEGRRCWLFHPNPTRPSAAAQRYIERGERRGVHRAYKCACREPWFITPLVEIPDLLLTYMDTDRPRVCRNRAGVAHLNSVYGIRLHPGRRRDGAAMLPLASLNSVTLLGAEVVGRAYGGGLLKLEPNEAERLPIPSIELVKSASEKLLAIAPQVARLLRSSGAQQAAKLVDRVLLMETGALSAKSLSAIRSARSFLRERRLTRGRSFNAKSAHS